MSGEGERVALPGRGTRKSIVVLCVLILLVGSPWVQDRFLDLYVEEYDNKSVRWLVEAAFVPGWGFSPDEYREVSWLVVTDVSTLVLIVSFVFFASRLTARGTSGWLRAPAAGLLASEVTALVQWQLFRTFVDDDIVLSADGLRGYLMGPALVFGLATGGLLALLTVGPRRFRVAPPVAGAFRARKGNRAMTTGPLHMPVGRVRGDVTRYLCTAAHVDEAFAERVVEEVLADEAGAVAPSPDVDLVAVAQHCLAAKEARYLRDLRVTAAFAAVAVVAPLWVLFPAFALGVVSAAGSTRPSLATRGSHLPASRVMVTAVVRAAVVVLCAFPLGYAISALPVPGFVGWLLGGYLAGVPAVLVSLGATAYAYVTVARHDLATDRRLRSTMTGERFYRQPLPAVPARPWIAARLAALKDARDGNVTVYSGYSPFLGYAATASNWSVAVPLLPAEEPVDAGTADEPRPFTVVELIAHVREQLRAVGAGGAADGAGGATEEGPETAEALRSLTVEDRIFVSGTSVGDDGRFVLDTQISPAARLSPEAVEEIMLGPTGTVRHCLAVHVPLWGGDVVPSVFLHFSTAGRTLHLHCDNHVLGPVAAAYHVVDRLRGPLSAQGQRGVLVTAVARTARTFFRAPLDALRHARFETRHTRRMVDELTAMEQDPVYDYGARLSIREIAMSPNYHNYFQVVDAARITAAVERHTLAAIREFLDARGYDITDFRTQQQTILNQGLIQQGGMSIIGNQAIGSGASANQHVGGKPAPAAPTK
ncbi:hypothetical protein ACIQAC_38275 [Streptomyces sp. NPDC088387]|uniref:hypothetical protein n=1 Tax=Streptomyces sp. NPDC088387 TaxID=3365859 RepID=UPI003808A834